MTLQEVKLKLAAEEGFSSLAMWTNHYKKEEAVSLMMDKIARLYAEAKCKEQREICATHSEVWIVDQEELHQKEDILGVGVYEKSILNAPAPKMD